MSARGRCLLIAALGLAVIAAMVLYPPWLVYPCAPPLNAPPNLITIPEWPWIYHYTYAPINDPPRPGRASVCRWMLFAQCGFVCVLTCLAIRLFGTPGGSRD